MPTRDTVDHALNAANPVVAEALARAELEATLDELGGALTLQAQEPRAARTGQSHRRRLGLPRTTRGVALACAIGLLVVGGAAAATTILTTYTGDYNKGWEVRAGGPGENLLEGAPNFCRAALRLSSDITYPSGFEAWRPWVLITEAEQPKVTTTGACGTSSSGGEGQPTLVSTGALRGWFAMSAFCAWVYDWRDAESSGNTAEASDAASVIAGALKWPAVVAEDPHPSATSGPYDGFFSAEPDEHMTLFGWFIPLQSDVASGDVAGVTHLVAGNSQCSVFDPTADSDGGTVNPMATPTQGQS